MGLPLSHKPMTGAHIRQTVRQIAAQLTGANLRLHHPTIEKLAENMPDEEAPLEDLAGVVLAGVNHCYLKHANRVLWFLDLALDGNKKGSDHAEQMLRALAKNPTSAPPKNQEIPASEGQASFTLAEIQRVLGDPKDFWRTDNSN